MPWQHLLHRSSARMARAKQDFPVDVLCSMEDAVGYKRHRREEQEEEEGLSPKAVKRSGSDLGRIPNQFGKFLK